MSNDKTFFNLKYDYLKIIVILNSNSAMANLKLEHWSRAVNAALRGRRILGKLKKLIDDDEKFKTDFGTLKEKLDYRMLEARKNQEFMYAFYHHSDEPEEGLGLGSLISHNDDGWGRPGIFTDSKVLMYDFQRGDSIKGVIINKTTSGIRVGGPVGLSRRTDQTEKVFLHNIPNLPKSKKVIKDVYWHDGPGADLDDYKNNPNFQIREYYGYASWFEGQLDGEI